MPMPLSPAAFPDARAFLDRALDSEKGTRAVFPTRRAALAFRFRCYTVRSRDRGRAAKIYPAGTPGHGVSAYDSLSLMLFPSENGAWQLIASQDPDTLLGSAAIIEDL